MLLTHPDRKHKPPRPRAGRSDWRSPTNTGSGSGGGLGVGSTGGAGGGSGITGHGYFHVGGNAFVAGGGGAAGMGGYYYYGSHVSGASSKGTYDAVGHGVGEGDITLVDPGQVR